MATTLPSKKSIEIWSFGFWGEGESGVPVKKNLKKQEQTTSHHIRGRLLLRLQEVYNANIQRRLPVITYSRINIYTERKCSSADLALGKNKNKKVWT